MSQFDHLDLDGHLLRLLLAVHEERSVTRAAQRLGVSQSAVSHLLDKLRGIVGDPLFVRPGAASRHRPRAGAGGARPGAAGRIARIRRCGGFDPASVVADSQHRRQRPAARPAAARTAAHLRDQAPGLSLRVIPSGVPSARDAARGALPAGHHTAPARRQRRAAKAPVRGSLPGVLRPRSAARTGHAGAVPERRPRDRALRDGAPPRSGRCAGRPGRARATSWRRCRDLPALGLSCGAARCWPRCPACCAPICCADSSPRRCRLNVRQCRCTWSGTCATTATCCTDGCASSWRRWLPPRWRQRRLICPIEARFGDRGRVRAQETDRRYSRGLSPATVGA
jgi:hypothetical protein